MWHLMYLNGTFQITHLKLSANGCSNNHTLHYLNFIFVSFCSPLVLECLESDSNESSPKEHRRTYERGDISLFWKVESLKTLFWFINNIFLCIIHTYGYAADLFSSLLHIIMLHLGLVTLVHLRISNSILFRSFVSFLGVVFVRSKCLWCIVVELKFHYYYFVIIVEFLYIICVIYIMI